MHFKEGAKEAQEACLLLLLFYFIIIKRKMEKERFHITCIDAVTYVYAIIWSSYTTQPARSKESDESCRIEKGKQRNRVKKSVCPYPIQSTASMFKRPLPARCSCSFRILLFFITSHQTTKSFSPLISTKNIPCNIPCNALQRPLPVDHPDWVQITALVLKVARFEFEAPETTYLRKGLLLVFAFT